MLVLTVGSFVCFVSIYNIVCEGKVKFYIEDGSVLLLRDEVLIAQKSSICVFVAKEDDSQQRPFAIWNKINMGATPRTTTS